MYRKLRCLLLHYLLIDVVEYQHGCYNIFVDCKTCKNSPRLIEIHLRTGRLDT